MPTLTPSSAPIVETVELEGELAQTIEGTLVEGRRRLLDVTCPYMNAELRESFSSEMTTSVCPALINGVNEEVAEMTECSVQFVADDCDQVGAFVDYVVDFKINTVTVALSSGIEAVDLGIPTSEAVTETVETAVVEVTTGATNSELEFNEIVVRDMIILTSSPTSSPTETPPILIDESETGFLEAVNSVKGAIIIGSLSAAVTLAVLALCSKTRRYERKTHSGLSMDSPTSDSSIIEIVENPIKPLTQLSPHDLRHH